MRPMTITGAGAAGGGHLMEKQSAVNSVRELWNEWEIHCLILASLFLQVFLFLFAGMRRRSSWWFLRTILWLAYLSADSVAVFVLGHLAVRATEPGHQLMALWAPFVLIHLGGQDTITAFSKQDNELWKRHLLNLVIQVAVAGYVVGKASWPDGRRVKAAMVLMFLCGCIKYVERTVCLYFSDPTGVLKRWVELYLSPNTERPSFISPREAALRAPVRMERTSEEEAIKRHMRDTLDMMSRGSSGPSFRLYWDAFRILPDIIIVDAPINSEWFVTVAAADLLPGMLEEFLSREDRHSAYERVGALLGHCYRRLYTKDFLRENLIVYRPLFVKIMNLSAVLPWALTSIALALFLAAEKGGQLHASRRIDIVVSYLLLVGAIVLDVSSAAIFIFSHLSFYLPAGVLCLANSIQPARCKKQWSQELGQYNMINSAGMGIIRRQLFGCDVTRTPVHTPVKKFILDTLLVSGTRKEWHIASTHGQLALHNWMNNSRHREQQSTHSASRTTCLLKALEEETLRSAVDFPTSVLIWHIATDMCFGGTNSDQVVEKQKQISRELSDYIMYLVFKCGVMLTTNSQVVHDNTEAEIVDILPRFRRGHNLGEEVMKFFEGKNDIQIEHEESEVQQQNTNGADNHMKKLQQSNQALKSSVLPRARALAQDLISIKDDADRWELIAAVWAEMLYYTAPRCGGGFHYEHLSTGGEFVTHVLALMYYLGPFMPPAF